MVGVAQMTAVEGSMAQIKHKWWGWNREHQRQNGEDGISDSRGWRKCHRGQQKILRMAQRKAVDGECAQKRAEYGTENTRDSTIGMTQKTVEYGGHGTEDRYG